MRFLFACALGLGAWGQSIAVLDQAQIEKLEVSLARNPGDLQGQTLLGQNYVFVILGITKLGKYDMVDGIDAARSKGEFAEHARDALRHSTLPHVVGDAGMALWR